MLKTIGLMRFIRGDHDNNVPGCANYYNGGCVFDCPCKVEKGKRCAYFEKSVLPAAIGLGLQTIVSDAYAAKVGLSGFCPKKLKNIRLCGCGAALKPRQRYCEKCSEKKRRDTYRKMRDAKRLMRHT